MEQYYTKKKFTDEMLHNIRQRGQKLAQHYSDQIDRQRTNNLTKQNGGSAIKDSDKINLNVGGTEMYALKETLTKVKGSCLEALFSGRWEDKLLHDEQGHLFLDMYACYFKKIMEHLHSMTRMSKRDGDNNTDVSAWPKLPNKTKQKTLELYIDLFFVRQEEGTAGKDKNTYFSSITENSNKNMKCLVNVAMICLMQSRRKH